MCCVYVDPCIVHELKGETDMFDRFKLQNRMGKSWYALERAVMLAQAMRLFDDPMLSDTMPPEIKRVRAITAWGIFNLSV